MKVADKASKGIKRAVDEIIGIGGTYALLQKLSSIDGADIGGELLDRVMYSFEALPPLGKEYWWFLFFGRDGRQMMLLVFRKFGTSMILNGQEVALNEIGQNKAQAAMTGWIYEQNQMHDLGVANPTVDISSPGKALNSEISGRRMTFKGGFPEYELSIDGLVCLKMTKGDFLDDRCAHGVFVPPFGAGWVDIFSNAEGHLLGREFKGTAHLQKVIGVLPYGPFNWARIIFQNSSTFSFFCLRTGKDSKKHFHRSMNFYDHENKRYIRFRNPILGISYERGETPMWTIVGQDEDNELRIVLEVYAEKRFDMNGGGSQVYIEYAVISREFSLRRRDRTITLQDLGVGVGTFEDAYGSVFRRTNTIST